MLTETAQLNFSRKQRNSYGAYATGTAFNGERAKRQRQSGSGMVETRQNLNFQ